MTTKEWQKKYPERTIEIKRRWKKNHPDKVREVNKRWRKNNPEKVNEYMRKWRKNNLEKTREYMNKYVGEYAKNKRKICPKFKIDKNMASIIGTCLKGRKAGRKWESLVNYTIDDLIKHLEKQLNENMTWDNYGSYWVIDHIKPKSLFKYKDSEDKEFQKCWGLNNLQPLEKIANIKKGNYYYTGL